MALNGLCADVPLRNYIRSLMDTGIMDLNRCQYIKHDISSHKLTGYS